MWISIYLQKRKLRFQIGLNEISAISKLISINLRSVPWSGFFGNWMRSFNISWATKKSKLILLEHTKKYICQIGQLFSKPSFQMLYWIIENRVISTKSIINRRINLHRKSNTCTCNNSIFYLHGGNLKNCLTKFFLFKYSYLIPRSTCHQNKYL